MTKNNKFFVVTMYKYGDREKHSYVLGVFNSKHIAQTLGDVEKVYRGGKYEPDIFEVVLNADMTLDDIFPNNWKTKRG